MTHTPTYYAALALKNRGFSLEETLRLLTSK